MNESLSSEHAGEEVDFSLAFSDQELICPRCQSERVETRGYGKKIGGAMGAIAGIGSGIALVLSGADLGAVTGAGTKTDGLARGVLAVLKSGSAGCVAGAAFGDVIDEEVLDKHRCVECGHTFSQRRVDA